MCGVEQAASVVKGSSNSAAIASEAREHGGRTTLLSDTVINLDHGDPTMYEPYWRKTGDKCTVVISGSQSLSYFADTKNFCWFLEAELEKAIKRLHFAVGNAVVEDHHVVVGTGSTQLFQAALYALTPPEGPHPVSVVSAVPYYSSYSEVTDFLQSRLYKWAGDANCFNKDGAYIELVTSPNNPDGNTREAIVNRAQGKVVHDLAYYWPQYTPITKSADFDVMLFTVSKCTGHAGSRIGWALVKDTDVAKRMTKFMELNTIGVSKESQLRAAKILDTVADSCLQLGSPDLDNLFRYGQLLMTERWEKLRDVVGCTDLFSLPEYPEDYCHFTGKFTQSHPAFAWIKCNNNSMEDCDKLLRRHKIITRNGKRFGVDSTYVRVSMVSREEDFNMFLERLMAVQGIENGN